MEKDFLFISPLLFDIVIRHNSFIEIEFVVSAESTEQSVKEMYDTMSQRASAYEVRVDWLFLYPVVKIRIQRKDLIGG